VDKAILHALERNPADRPATAAEWFDELETARGRRAETPDKSDSRLVVMAPNGSEVYVDDERQASVGRSGRVVLRAIAPGQHVMRVARTGEVDDERVIEIRADGIEQIIQAQFGKLPQSHQLTPSRGGSLDSRAGGPETTPGVVACTQCGSRFAAGTRFCGRCGNRSFQQVAVTGTLPAPTGGGAAPAVPSQVTCPRCQRAYPSSIKFCGKCGIPIGAQSLDWRQPRPVEVVCKQCGGSYPGGTKFCGRCGKPISP